MMRTATLVMLATFLALPLTACGGDEMEGVPETGVEAAERAVEAGPGPGGAARQRRTGAEIQDRMTNRIVQAEYACLDGERLSVTFDNPREMATVRMIDGTAIDLRQERAADGIWYRADRYDLRGRGTEATWQAPDKNLTSCRAVN